MDQTNTFRLLRRSQRLERDAGTSGDEEKTLPFGYLNFLESIILSIYLSMDLFIYQSIYLSIYLIFFKNLT